MQRGFSIDSDVRFAVEALDGLRNSKERPGLVTRVSSIPLVMSSLSQLNHAYEVTKNAHGVLRYSAESVESGVKSLAPMLAPLDRLAASTLDSIQNTLSNTLGVAASLENHARISMLDHSLQSLDNTPKPSTVNGPHTGSTSTENTPPNTNNAFTVENTNFNTENNPEKSINQNNAQWPMVSETMRGLGYCIQYLKHALHNIKVQISILSQHMYPFQNHPQIEQPPQSNAVVGVGNTLNFNGLIVSVRREVVEILRRVVDLLGRYAGYYLPTSAKDSVRGFILNLPGRLAFLTTRTTPLKTHNEDMIEAQKVLVLASETKNTLEGVNQIFLKSISMFGDNQTNFSAEESMERF